MAGKMTTTTKKDFGQSGGFLDCDLMVRMLREREQKTGPIKRVVTAFCER